MKRMVREKKDRCSRTFCEDSGLRDPWEVVRWARDPWRTCIRMEHLWGSNGRWLEDDGTKVESLVKDVLGTSGEDPEPWVSEGLWVGFPFLREEVWGWVLRAPGKTKNGSAPGLDGVSYRLIKAVRDTQFSS